MCPKVDDPVTENQVYRELLLTVQSSSAMSGNLGFQFQGVTAFLDLDSPTEEDCSDALVGSGKFATVNCSVSVNSATEVTYQVQIQAWPLTPKENNLHTHFGNPSIDEFLCDVSRTSGGVTCTFTDIANSNLVGMLSIMIIVLLNDANMY